MSILSEQEAGFLTAAEPLAFVDARTREIVEHRRASPRPMRRGWLMRRMLVCADLLGVALAFYISSFADHPAAGSDHIAAQREFLLLIVVLPFWVVLAKLYGLYERDEERADHSTLDDFVAVFHLVTVCVWLFYLLTAATRLANPPLVRLVLLWGLAVVLVNVNRATARAICRRGTAYLQNTLIVGAGDVGQLLGRKILSHPEYGLNVVGFVDDRPKERNDDIEQLMLLGSRADIPDLIGPLDIERIIVAFSNDSAEETLSLIRLIKDLDIQIDIVPRLFEVVGANVNLHTLEGVPLVGLPPLRLSRSSRLLKRCFDVTLSGVGLIFLAPLLAAVSLVILFDSRSPVFFRQTRMGAGDRTFSIFKFRTMVVDAEAQKAQLAHLNMHATNGGGPRMFKIPKDPRVTRVGAVLRRTRIDELPQLFNVLRGEMSLVGPRPLILEEDKHIVDWGRKRLDLRPGITGLWQVLGASDIPFEEMIKLDYLYVTNWSLSEDLRLIFKTFSSIVRSRRAV